MSSLLICHLGFHQPLPSTTTKELPEKVLQRSFFTPEVFTHSELSHREAFKHSKLSLTHSKRSRTKHLHTILFHMASILHTHTQKLLRRDAFTHRETFTQQTFTHSKRLHTETLRRRNFLRTAAFTHSKLLHREAFTDSKLSHTESIYTQNITRSVFS